MDQDLDAYQCGALFLSKWAFGFIQSSREADTSKMQFFILKRRPFFSFLKMTIFRVFKKNVGHFICHSKRWFFLQISFLFFVLPGYDLLFFAIPFWRIMVAIMWILSFLFLFSELLYSSMKSSRNYINKSWYFGSHFLCVVDQIDYSTRLNDLKRLIRHKIILKSFVSFIVRWKNERPGRKTWPKKKKKRMINYS